MAKPTGPKLYEVLAERVLEHAAAMMTKSPQSTHKEIKDTATKLSKDKKAMLDAHRRGTTMDELLGESF